MSDIPNILQQEAQELATRCAQVLQHRFGARRVIPFGSVVGHGIWHPGSDIDLAVEGLAPEQFFRAWAALRELLPPGLEVDCERILERIAVTVDGSVPSGAFSHANLLAQMARELPGIRPAVLPEALVC